MNSLFAQQLLLKVSRKFVKDRNDYSKEEIIGKINEIKYLAAQKKVPKLTLRKEIIHLENKLQSIFEVEKQMLARDNMESSKIKSLKKENANLKERLAKVHDKDLQKKVDKLSHLLGECLAKSNIAHDVALTHKVQKELKLANNLVKKELPIAKIHVLEAKLHALKMNVAKKREEDPKKAEMLEEKLPLLKEG